MIPAANDLVLSLCTEEALYWLTGTFGFLALLASGARP